MFTIEIVDYRNPIHARDLLTLLDHYARDPMGGGKSLKAEVKATLVNELARLAHAFSLIGYQDNQPIALANCFEVFSTFNAKPIVNVHDLMVHADYRGQGYAQKMLFKVEEIARARGCCKITLEVLEGNHRAQKSYKQFGFAGYELDAKTGNALFWQKSLN